MANRYTRITQVHLWCGYTACQGCGDERELSPVVPRAPGVVVHVLAEKFPPGDDPVAIQLSFFQESGRQAVMALGCVESVYCVVVDVIDLHPVKCSAGHIFPVKIYSRVIDNRKFGRQHGCFGREANGIRYQLLGPGTNMAILVNNRKCISSVLYGEKGGVAIKHARGCSTGPVIRIEHYFGPARKFHLDSLDVSRNALGVMHLYPERKIWAGIGIVPGLYADSIEIDKGILGLSTGRE